MKVSNMIKKGVKVKKITLILIAMAYGLVGCGGTGTNNDQGTSVLAFGYFEPSEGGTGIGPAVSFFTDSLNNGQSTFLALGVQNRLVGADSWNWCWSRNYSCCWSVLNSNSNQLFI